ncbi:uncharacterized protein [Epargyreus clarus]|uniref:uncharacterized protein n=1 Tax=Epargyreus clarus TaxID=520877 RepID=UPI003C2C4B0B
MNLLLLGLICTASAMPSYIALPADQIAFVDLTALRARRVPREALAPPAPLQALYDDYQGIQHAIPIQNFQQPNAALAPPPLPEAARQQAQPQADSAEAPSQGGPAQFAERPPDFGEYVDFGAHTGDHGAFGWYADYPVNNQEDHGYGK